MIKVIVQVILFVCVYAGVPMMIVGAHWGFNNFISGGFYEESKVYGIVTIVAAVIGLLFGITNEILYVLRS